MKIFLHDNTIQTKDFNYKNLNSITLLHFQLKRIYSLYSLFRLSLKLSFDLKSIQDENEFAKTVF
jgi:hypothetical protein